MVPHGFVILRQPDMNFDERGRGVYSRLPTALGSLFYNGIDRMPWFDIEEDLYTGTLSEDIRRLYNQLKQPVLHLPRLTGSLEVATVLLRYANQLGRRNEIVAVCSAATGEQRLAELPGAQYLGVDIVTSSGQSLLSTGIFIAPSAFLDWRELLNPFGLLPEGADIQSYSNRYVSAAAEGLVEPIDDEASRLIPVRLWRVPDSHPSGSAYSNVAHHAGADVDGGSGVRRGA